MLSTLFENVNAALSNNELQQKNGISNLLCSSIDTNIYKNSCVDNEINESSCAEARTCDNNIIDDDKDINNNKNSVKTNVIMISRNVSHIYNYNTDASGKDANHNTKSIHTTKKSNDNKRKRRDAIHPRSNAAQAANEISIVHNLQSTSLDFIQDSAESQITSSKSSYTPMDKQNTKIADLNEESYDVKDQLIRNDRSCFMNRVDDDLNSDKQESDNISEKSDDISELGFKKQRLK